MNSYQTLSLVNTELEFFTIIRLIKGSRGFRLQCSCNIKVIKISTVHRDCNCNHINDICLGFCTISGLYYISTMTVIAIIKNLKRVLNYMSKLKMIKFITSEGSQA